jgi:hypothetical protein
MHEELEEVKAAVLQEEDSQVAPQRERVPLERGPHEKGPPERDCTWKTVTARYWP